MKPNTPKISVWREFALHFTAKQCLDDIQFQQQPNESYTSEALLLIQRLPALLCPFYVRIKCFSTCLNAVQFSPFMVDLI